LIFFYFGEKKGKKINSTKKIDPKNRIN